MATTASHVATSSASSSATPTMPAGADFLRRLSVADAKVLLDRTRKEKESKTKEMQKMIGVRYRDLIESADKIVNMHSAALRLEGSLKEMPCEWNRVEAALAATLADASRPDAHALQSSRSEQDESVAGVARDMPTTTSALERVQLLVAVPEQMWQLLDRGESFRALELYLAATKARESAGFDVLAHSFPFLPAAWSCVEGFRPRLLASARTFLACRGKVSAFYAQNLCTLAVLSEPRLSIAQLFQTFLDSRVAWIAPSAASVNVSGSISATASAPVGKTTRTLAQQERHLIVVVRAMNLTVLHTETLFDAASAFAAFRNAFTLQPALQSELEQFVASGALQRAMTQWFVTQRREIETEVASTIRQITSIGQLAKVQAKLSRANALDGDCAQSTLWRAIAPSVSSSPATAAIVRSEVEHSPFAALFADAFRQRTRDLVQHSFVEALDAVTTQIHAVVDNAVGESSRTVATTRLGCVAFYDYFEAIHAKAADLDASDLQGVLTEEFLRTLLKLVVFLEREYALHVDADATSHSTGDANKFLCVSNLLSAILAGFATRSSKLFPTASGSAVGTDSSDFARVREAFEASASDGQRMSKVALRSALQQLSQQEQESALPRFIDEELRSLESLGLHAFHLVVEIANRGARPQTFVNVVRELARAYCERWTRAHLDRKIDPLRERIRMEQYDASNEEWIKSHDGWVQQLIVDDSVGTDADDDSVSETEALGEERVWLPWCETSTVSSFLFQCCYMLDEANRLVRSSTGATESHVTLMHEMIRDVLVEQLTIISVEAYDEGVTLLVRARARQLKQRALNFGECCILQFLFDMYFVRATLGFSDFIRFGWGDELDPSACSPALRKLTGLFAKMQDFVDPVDWEIYGPQLVENVVVQFRKSRLLFSSLSESNDINEINGKQVAVSAQDTRPVVRIAEPVARFSLLPVPSSTRRLQRKASPPPGRLDVTSGADVTNMRGKPPPTGTANLSLHEPRASESASASLKLQNILSSSTTGSNLLSAAASGTNLLSSAAKGMSYLSSATSSYLREGESRPKYF